jgi:hypothetical protein
LSEWPRLGETGSGDCPACADDPALGRVEVWSDERWRLHVLRDFPLAGTCLLETRRHVDGLVDLDTRELAELGPLSARVSARCRPAATWAAWWSRSSATGWRTSTCGTSRGRSARSTCVAAPCSRAWRAGRRRRPDEVDGAVAYLRQDLS